MGESRSDASARERALRDDLLEVIGRTGVRQLPGLGKARVQAGGICFASPLGRGKRVAWEAGRRLRLRGVAHCAESANLGRGLPRVVALDQRASAGRADSLPGQRGDVEIARGCETTNQRGDGTMNRFIAVFAAAAVLLCGCAHKTFTTMENKTGETKMAEFYDYTYIGPD